MPTIRTNENPPPDVQRVPSDFHILEASGTSDFHLEAADGDDEQSRKLRRFRMTAYTGAKLLLANFPYPVVVDLSGLRIPAKSRPILRDHDSSRIVGHTESIEINGSSIRARWNRLRFERPRPRSERFGRQRFPVAGLDRSHRAANGVRRSG